MRAARYNTRKCGLRHNSSLHLLSKYSSFNLVGTPNYWFLGKTCSTPQDEVLGSSVTKPVQSQSTVCSMSNPFS
jgi:hypothetical protein